jgi:hypothetical protein
VLLDLQECCICTVDIKSAARVLFVFVRVLQFSFGFVKVLLESLFVRGLQLRRKCYICVLRFVRVLQFTVLQHCRSGIYFVFIVRFVQVLQFSSCCSICKSVHLAALVVRFVRVCTWQHYCFCVAEFLRVLQETGPKKRHPEEKLRDSKILRKPVTELCV